MESVLEQLYNGELYPYSKFKPTIEQFKIDRDKAFNSYSKLLAKLPDELKDEFTKLMDDHLNLLPLELKQNFIDGFRIGTRMMAEVFADPIAENDT